MKKLIYSVLVIVLYCGTLSAQQDFVTNGGFEDSPVNIMYTTSTTEVAGWLLEIQSGACSFMVSDQEAAVYAGDHGLMVNVTELGSDSYSLQAVGDSLHLEEEEFYKATLMVKSMVTDSAHMAFTVGRYDPFSEYARLGGGPDHYYRLAPFNEWRKLSVVFMAVVDLIRVPIHFQELGITYIDELHVTQSEICDAWIDESGDYLYLDLGINTDAVPAAFDLSNITLKVNGNDRGISSLEVDAETLKPLRSILKAQVAGTIGTGAAVTISYSRPASGFLTYDDARVDANYPNDKVPKFTNMPVENLSTVVGVHDFNATSALTWYLNESRDLLTVDGLETAELIEIYSITGQLIKSVRVSNTRETIGMSEFPAGVYILSVRNLDRSVENAKFMK